jgi:hypothetical protein
MFSAYLGSNYFLAYINKLQLSFVNPTYQNDENILYNSIMNNTFRLLKTTNMSGLQKRKKWASLYRRHKIILKREFFSRSLYYIQAENKQSYMISEIIISHNSNYEDCFLLGCDAM